VSGDVRFDWLGVSRVVRCAQPGAFRGLTGAFRGLTGAFRGLTGALLDVRRGDLARARLLQAAMRFAHWLQEQSPLPLPHLRAEL
jgi:hypothetical protein